MKTDRKHWELTIIDANPPTDEMAGMAVGDIDNDGNVEIIINCAHGLLWYRPATHEKGMFLDGHFPVAVTLEDVDGDGRLEILTSRKVDADSPWTAIWVKPGATLTDPVEVHMIDPECTGQGHDFFTYDIDGDGKPELIGNAAYCATPQTVIYKPGEDITAPWSKHVVGEGMFLEGLNAAVLEQGAKPSIVHGPDWFVMPESGPYGGQWERRTYAPAFREMSRTALVDMTGNGALDIVIVESEYTDGKMSWFENRLDQGEGWVEHEIMLGLNFAHSLTARREADGTVHIFNAEMAAGGWNQPYNHDARLLDLVSKDNGQSWETNEIYRGYGTHQAIPYDIDNDGELEIVGKEWGKANAIPRVQIWKKAAVPSPILNYQHRFIDRDKPCPGPDILGVVLNGSGMQDIACASFWYKNPTWERYEIGPYQVLNSHDIDGDGKAELIVIKKPDGATNREPGLSNQIYWLKPIDPVAGQWEEHFIGTGTGDWPHSTIVAPLLPGGKLALVAGYHNAHKVPPEIFEVPDDPTQSPWPMRVIADINYGEEILAHDMTGNGLVDIVAGKHILENNGDGTFTPHQITTIEGKVARTRLMDVNGNGRMDVVFVIESLDWGKTKTAFWAEAGWLENPGDPRQKNWTVHIIDKLRSPHSLDVADLDNDGELEIIVGEHDPFNPARSRSGLYVYKKAEPKGRAWKRWLLDGRFEHHDGTKVITLESGKTGIMSHAWREKYVHLWEPV